MLTLAELVESERQLALGDARTYRARCAPDATFVVPGMVLDLESCARAVEESPGWDEVDIGEERLVRLGEETAAVVYLFTGRRGAQVYRAVMTSVYAVADGSARLVLHQQTPQP